MKLGLRSIVGSWMRGIGWRIHARAIPSLSDGEAIVLFVGLESWR